MSDFNDNLVARSPKEWVASMYLSEKQKVIDDVYFFNKSNDNSGDKARGRRSLKASLESLFSVCEPRLIDLYKCLILHLLMLNLKSLVHQQLHNLKQTHFGQEIKVVILRRQ